MENLKHPKAFNGDYFLQDHIKELVEKHGITTIVETGTFKGDTTAFFSDIVPSVFTVEKRADYQAEAEAIHKEKGCKGIHYTVGNSPEFIADKIYSDMDKTLFFLDAHWYSYCPLQDELRMIALKSKEQGKFPIILIHDFKVPDHPDFGFDSYNGQDYEWDWIKPDVDLVYDDYEHYFNEEAAGSKRGVVIIKPV